MTISVVYGGTPEECVPSKKNATDIADALKTKGYNVILMEFEKDIIHTLKSLGTDAVFLCVQGKGYGDGTFQGMLEAEGIPYTGSSMRAASLINDKILCKMVFEHYNINTPKWEILIKRSYEWGSFPYEEFGYPFVAKAPTQGGSFGIEFIKSRNDLSQIENVFNYDSPILLEKYIDGPFYTVGIYEGKNGLITLPPVEGINMDQKPGELIDFTGRYDIKNSSLSGELETSLKDMAKKVFKVTSAFGYGRIDFMIDKNDHTPYVLEINAVPGLKRSSLMPLAAAKADIIYEDMIEDILKSAFKHRRK